jgi:hypothetical protein
VFESQDSRRFCVVLATETAELVGFARGQPHADAELAEFDGELNKIYLLRAYHRRGLGRRLLCASARRFLERGISSMLLFGDARSPTNRFYEAMGGERLYAPNGDFHGGYGWRDLAALVTAHCARSVVVILAMVSWNLPLSAQEAGTSRAAGHAAGRAAAGDGSIAPAFIVGLIGGIPIGISGARYLDPETRNEARATPALAGAGILIGGTVGIHLTSHAPQARGDLAGPDVDEYNVGFREGYESRLRSRRRNALGIGGLVGMGVGAVAYRYLIRATSRY